MKKIFLFVLSLAFLSLAIYNCGSNKEVQASDVGSILSEDISLESIEISEGSLSPSFLSNVYVYDARVTYTTDSVTVTIKKKDPASIVSVDGQIVSADSLSSNVSLDPGLNIITVAVRSSKVAEEIIYTLNIVRGKNIAYLYSLDLSSGFLNPTFLKTVSGYSVQVDSNVASINLMPVPMDQDAEVKVNGEVLQFGTSSQSIDLVAGEPKTINVTVTSSDRTATMTYSVTATRALCNNANLSALDVVGGTLSPNFDKDILIYSVNIPASVTSLMVAPVLEDNTATISVLGNTNIIPAGYSVVNIKVTAQDLSVKTYTLVINRGESNCALSSLNIKDSFDNDLIINPLFSPDTTNYVLQLDAGITSIRVITTSFDPDALIEITGDDVDPLVGVNLVTVSVKSSDNSSQRTYNITVVSP